MTRFDYNPKCNCPHCYKFYIKDLVTRIEIKLK